MFRKEVRLPALPWLKPMRSLCRLCLLLGLFPLVAGTTPAESAEAIASAQPTGRDLAQQAHDRDVGADSVAQMQMELVTASGAARVREFTVYSKTSGPIRKGLIRFTAPADIAGTGFLVLEIPDGTSDQFLYLPALKRSRRIVSGQKNRSFVNSDFTYEDMERRRLDDADYQIAGAEEVDGFPCWVLETRPHPDTGSAYSLIKSWIGKTMAVPLRAEYYDRKGAPVKTYRVNKVEQIQGLWTETQVVMKNLEDRHETRLRVVKINYNTGLDDAVFTTRSLESW